MSALFNKKDSASDSYANFRTQGAVRSLDASLMSLNVAQLDAVTCVDHALLVLSGAGTGKTKVLTTRIAYLIERGYVFPSQILAVTFSNKAAKEMKERLFALTSYADGVWLGTFHAVCARILRAHSEVIGIDSNFTIIDLEDQLKIIKQILKDVNLDIKSSTSILSKISRLKDKCIDSDSASNTANLSEDESKVYRIYQSRLISCNYVDFGDLLLYVIKIFMHSREILQKYCDKFKHILVDEYQDTNTSQYNWLKMLSPSGNGICCVGDDDQSIYSWRGAEIGNILRFENDFENTKIIRLEQNYRSCANILGAASSLISKNVKRFEKTIWTQDGDGDKVKVHLAYNGFDEAQYVVERIIDLCHSEINYSDVAILVRAGFQTREFEERLIAYQVPYKVIGGLKFYDRMEIKDITAYLRLIYQPNDNLAFERIINTPRRGIGASAVGKIHEYASEHNLSLFRASQDIIQNAILKPSTNTSLSKFVSLISGIKNNDDLAPADIAKKILEETGYLDSLAKEKTTESANRIENLKELVIAISDFKSLASFMEHISLITDLQHSESDNVINVLTIHSSKGLEFDTVFLPGWEEGVFPNGISLQENNIEEERRLAYVGITRARKRVCITCASHRKVYNQWQSNVPSRFIFEISKEHLLNV